MGILEGYSSYMNDLLLALAAFLKDENKRRQYAFEQKYGRSAGK
jgi:hypothetical protein